MCGTTQKWCIHSEQMQMWPHVRNVVFKTMYIINCNHNICGVEKKWLLIRYDYYECGVYTKKKNT